MMNDRLMVTFVLFFCAPTRFIKQAMGPLVDSTLNL